MQEISVEVKCVLSFFIIFFYNCYTAPVFMARVKIDVCSGRLMITIAQGVFSSHERSAILLLVPSYEYAHL